MDDCKVIKLPVLITLMLSTQIAEANPTYHNPNLVTPWAR